MENFDKFSRKIYLLRNYRFSSQIYSLLNLNLDIFFEIVEKKKKEEKSIQEGIRSNN